MPLVSAEVVPSARGRAQLAALRRSFADLGFDVGVTGPASFSISGPQDVFQRTFTDTDFSKPLPSKLPIAALPSALKRLVTRVVTTTAYVPFTP